MGLLYLLLVEELLGTGLPAVLLYARDRSVKEQLYTVTVLPDYGPLEPETYKS